MNPDTDAVDRGFQRALLPTIANCAIANCAIANFGGAIDLIEAVRGPAAQTRGLS
jgi:hypothetical protein